MEQDPSLLEGETVIREHTRKKKATHEELFKGLKVEKVVVPLPEEDQICPVCGTQMVLIGEEYVRRELEFIPATCKVIEYYSQSYGCPSCKEGLGDTEKPVIVKSQVPPALLGKGPASAAAAAWTMYQKYANGLPLYRQSIDRIKIFCSLSHNRNDFHILFYKFSYKKFSNKSCCSCYNCFFHHSAPPLLS